MNVKELFPEVERVEPPPKVRKPRRKSKRFTPKENRQRYRLHRKVKDLGSVELRVRAREMVLPLGFETENFPYLNELIYRFKYQAFTIYEH